jgi:hypothetical protein
MEIFATVILKMLRMYRDLGFICTPADVYMLTIQSFVESSIGIIKVIVQVITSYLKFWIMPIGLSSEPN